MHEDTDLRSRIADLEEQLDSLKRTVDAGRPVSVEPTDEQPTTAVDPSDLTSRRRWIAGAGAAAAGAVVAVSSGRPAAAADPNDIVKDVDNVASGQTSLSGGRFRARDTGATPLVGFEASISGVTDVDTFNGVVGSTKRPSGYGVIAMADRAAGARSQLHIEPDGPPPPTGSGNRAGEIAVDQDADLWFAISPSESRKLAGPSTAGALHAVEPVRVFDSRLGSIPQSGIFGPGSNRTISIKDGYDFTGAVSAADAVPAGATAIVFNLTVTETTGPNFISVVPGSAADFATSSINFTTGQTLANGLTVGLDDDRQVKVFCGGAPGSTHVVLDVSGFYM